MNLLEEAHAGSCVNAMIAVWRRRQQKKQLQMKRLRRWPLKASEGAVLSLETYRTILDLLFMLLACDSR